MAHVSVADIVEVMEGLAPSGLAEKWDNSGLQAGSKKWPVKHIWVALDPLPSVVSAAIEDGADLLITHHPLIFHPLKSIDFSSPLGSVILKAANHKLSIFSAHTNLDSVHGGINDIFASIIGLKNLKVLGPEKDDESRAGIGRVGNLDKTMTLKALAAMIKQKFKAGHIKFTGEPDLPVRRVALCSGSGGSMTDDFFRSGAQVYITGDIGYHTALDVKNMGLGLIDLGHFTSEHIIVKKLAERLFAALSRKGMDIPVTPCLIEKDPFDYL